MFGKGGKKVSSFLALTDVPSPPAWPGLNKRLVTGDIGNSILNPIQIVGAFSDKQFEIFVLEWVHGYLSRKYVEVKQRGGAGDKGRDVIAWIDAPGVKPRRWDNYQCKHYDEPLSPSKFYVELGKLCYYTYTQAYTNPENYFIVTHKGVGPKLGDLLDNPIGLRNELIKNWSKYCENEITKTTAVKLDAQLLAYIKSFDFSIVKEISPRSLIDQHAETQYHAVTFQTRMRPRPNPVKPPEFASTSELTYINKMFEAFSEYLKVPVSDELCFSDFDELKQFYNFSRVCFYSAESLKEFARDNLPDESYFDDLEDQVYDGIQITLNYKHYNDGYQRMVETCDKSGSVPIVGNILGHEFKYKDRVGVCHHLANKNRIGWVK